MGKAVKYNFALCAAGEKGTFDSVLNFKYFINAVKFSWPIHKLLSPPYFPSFSCGPESYWGRLPSSPHTHTHTHRVLFILYQGSDSLVYYQQSFYRWWTKAMVKFFAFQILLSSVTWDHPAPSTDVKVLQTVTSDSRQSCIMTWLVKSQLSST